MATCWFLPCSPTLFSFKVMIDTSILELRLFLLPDLWWIAILCLQQFFQQSSSNDLKALNRLRITVSVSKRPYTNFVQIVAVVFSWIQPKVVIQLWSINTVSTFACLRISIWIRWLINLSTGKPFCELASPFRGKRIYVVLVLREQDQCLETVIRNPCCHCNFN